MKVQEVYKKENDTVIIRRAVPDDIDALINLSRISFPDQLIWHTKSSARKTWERFVMSEFQEVWIYELNSEVVAVIRFEKDINKCYKEIKEIRPDLFPILCYLITRPRILCEKVLDRIINKYSTDIIYDNETINLAKNSIRCHSSGVLPKMRNRGIGSKMMSVCEIRGFELGYDSIIFFIRTDNKGSIRLHERLGFKRVAKIKGGLYMFIKILSTQEV